MVLFPTENIFLRVALVVCPPPVAVDPDTVVGLLKSYIDRKVFLSFLLFEFLFFLLCFKFLWLFIIELNIAIVGLEVEHVEPSKFWLTLQGIVLRTPLVFCLVSDLFFVALSVIL